MSTRPETSSADEEPVGVAADGDDASFEELFARLESISGELETGSLPLDRAISLYEEGVALAERCQRLLTDVEQRIEHLRQRALGTEEDVR